MFQLAAYKKLRADVEKENLKDIEKLWEMEVSNGKD